MIKVIYKALIESTMIVDEHREGLLPFEQIKENYQNKLTDGIRELLKDEVFSDDCVTTFTLTEQQLDVWQEEDDVK